MSSKGYEPLTDEEIRVVRESTLSFASSKTYDEDDQLRAEFERDRTDALGAGEGQPTC